MFNPIKEPPRRQVETEKEAEERQARSLKNNIKKAVHYVASAMREGMLDDEDISLLEAGGIRRVEIKQTAYETFESLLGMAQAINFKIIEGDRVKIEDPAELAKLVGVVVKLMDMVRKSISEARRNEELTALESALHECLSDIQDQVTGRPELQEVVDAAMKNMMRNLEDRLRQIQVKYEE